MSRSLPAVEAFWLGSRPYRETWALQRALVEQIRAGTRPSTLLLLEHPHVYTMGRRGVEEHLIWDGLERARRGVELVWCDRGGDATYHGPGQLVGYPLLDLPALGSDILQHLRVMERSLIAYLEAVGVDSAPGGKGLTGVWAGDAKVAAIGVKLNDRRVTSHGFALNLTPDLDYFGGIVPCGLIGRQVTSVAQLTGRTIAVSTAAEAYLRHFEGAYGVSVSRPLLSGLDGLVEQAPPEPSPPQAMIEANVRSGC